MRLEMMAVILILLHIGMATCFYVPGNTPMEFKQGDNIDIKVCTLIAKLGVFRILDYSGSTIKKGCSRTMLD